MTKLLHHSKNVINGSPTFCLVEHKLESVTPFVMLKEKWEINFFANSDQDLIVPGSLEYHSSVGPPREQEKNFMR